MKEQRSNSADNLYLLSFIDLVDRLDILMLEIRHLQQTIIHTLKDPTLYLPLRFEEQYLFGNNWHTKLFQNSNTSHDFELAKKWMIRYPTPEIAVKYFYDNEKIILEGNTRKQINIQIKHRIGKIWMGDSWARDQRRQYHALSALQVLKQRVLHDKIVLSKAALRAKLFSNETNIPQQVLQKPAFLILREGVLQKVDTYISILRNHKHQIGQSLDFGTLSDPLPSIERRREMGIFMDFIFNRTLDIQRDILLLCLCFKEDEEDAKPSSNLWMFHSWSENTNVSSVQLHDEINASCNHFGVYEEKQQEQHIAYVNTSFWTPDRPDLHPMVAYPVAQSVVRNHLGSLNEVSLSNRQGEFTQLMIGLKSIFANVITTHPPLAYLEEELGEILKTIAADLLAASVKGVAYLYPLFITTIGKGLASQLYVGKRIKLDMVYSLEQGTPCYKHTILSYLRLQLTAFWVNKVIYEPSSLDKQIIAAVETISQELLDFLNSHTPANRDPIATHWKKLSDTLIEEINKSSALATSKLWCKKRAKDDDHSPNSKDSELERASKRRFPRSTRKLDARLQNYLFRQLLRLKKSSNKALACSTDLETDVKKQYGLTVEQITMSDEKNRYLSHPPSLFSHIYSIPYQAAFIRSIDMLHKANNENVFDQLHWDMELGRSLFGFALEFHARETVSPEQRLSLCVNQISYAYAYLKTKTTSEKLRNKLDDWLKSPKIDKQKITDHLSEMDNAIKLKKICSALKGFGAIHLIAAFEETPASNTKKTRYLEIIAGNKLRDLVSILENKGLYKGDKKILSLFSTLINFLSIRRLHGETKQDHPKKQFFYNKMLTALGDINEKDKDTYEQITSTKEQMDKLYLPDPIKSMLIKRISITNFYPISDPRNFSSLESANGMDLATSLKHQHWKTTFNQKNTKQEQKEDTWIILGRFDALSMVKVRLPCRCYIQGFAKNNTLPHSTDDTDDTNKYLEEKFPSHFLRREITRPVALLPKLESTEPCEMFAILSVTLQRRSMRLDFLYRLICSLDESESTCDELQSNMEEQIKNLRDNNILITGFLTDGWGDVLFKFSKATKEGNGSSLKESDIRHIFAFQQSVYEDFMVDGTEITFAPQCIDHTLGLSDDYKVTLEIRMMEDRWLEKGTGNYINTVRELQEKLPEFLQKIEMTMLTGRNDFKFTFTIKEKNKDKVIDKAFITLIKWLEGDLMKKTDLSNNSNKKPNAMRMLSHIETYIEKQVIL
jgi:hypothetical protein